MTIPKPSFPFFFLLSFIFSTSSLFAQPTRYLFNFGQQDLHDVAVLSNNNVVYTGSSGIHLIDFSSQQVKVDSQRSSIFKGPNHLAAGPNTTFFMTSRDQDSTFLTRYDQNFQGLWTRLIDSTGLYKSVAIEQLAPNRYLLTAGGASASNPHIHSGHGAFAVLDENGNILMGKKWASSGSGTSLTFAATGLQNDFYLGFSDISASYVLHLDLRTPAKCLRAFLFPLPPRFPILPRLMRCRTGRI